jgi:hypothetical protein
MAESFLFHCFFAIPTYQSPVTGQDTALNFRKIDLLSCGDAQTTQNSMKAIFRLALLLFLFSQSVYGQERPENQLATLEDE